jgi:hypothetical protein
MDLERRVQRLEEDGKRTRAMLEGEMARLRKAIYTSHKRRGVRAVNNVTLADIDADDKAAIIAFVGFATLEEWGLAAMYLDPDDTKIGDLTETACRVYPSNPELTRNLPYVYIGGPTGVPNFPRNIPEPMWNAWSVIPHLVRSNVHFYNGMCPTGRELHQRQFADFYGCMRASDVAAIITFYRQPYALEWPLAQLFYFMARGSPELYLLVQTDLQMPDRPGPEEPEEPVYENLTGTVADVRATMRERYAETVALLARAVYIYKEAVARNHDMPPHVFEVVHSEDEFSGLPLAAQLAKASANPPVQGVATLASAIAHLGTRTHLMNARPGVTYDLRRQWYEEICVHLETRTDTAFYLKRVFELTLLGSFREMADDGGAHSTCVAATQALLLGFAHDLAQADLLKAPHMKQIYPVACLLNAMLPPKRQVQFLVKSS